MVGGDHPPRMRCMRTLWPCIERSKRPAAGLAAAGSSLQRLRPLTSRYAKQAVNLMLLQGEQAFAPYLRMLPTAAQVDLPVSWVPAEVAQLQCAYIISKVCVCVCVCMCMRVCVCMCACMHASSASTPGPRAPPNPSSHTQQEVATGSAAGGAAAGDTMTESLIFF